MSLILRWKRYSETHLSTCFITMFSFNVVNRTSSAIDCLLVDPMRGTACVIFKNGYSYVYLNVSRRAIVNLLMNKNMSLGFWVNENLINTKRVFEQRIAAA